MPDVQFEENNFNASTLKNSQLKESFLVRLAKKLGAKDDAQAQKVLLGIAVAVVILTIIVLL